MTANHRITYFGLNISDLKKKNSWDGRLDLTGSASQMQTMVEREKMAVSGLLSESQMVATAKMAALGSMGDSQMGAKLPSQHSAMAAANGFRVLELL